MKWSPECESQSEHKGEARVNDWLEHKGILRELCPRTLLSLNLLFLGQVAHYTIVVIRIALTYSGFVLLNPTQIPLTNKL